MLSKLTPYAEEMIEDISVDLNVTGELLIIQAAFVNYFSRKGKQ